MPHSNEGVISAQSSGDGYSIALTWERAYPDSLGFQVSYNIYFSTIREDVFTEGPKYLSIPPDLLTTTITNFTPGDTYFFAVKATEFDSTVVDLSLLPDSGTSKIYPEGMLLTPMTSTSTTINLSDIEDFPPFGIIQVGVELIRYTNKDQVNDLLLGLTRGYYNSSIREHEIDGYDGVRAEDPIIRFWRGFEDPNEAVSLERSYFAYPNFPYTTTDGYKVDPDLLTTDLHGSDEAQADFGSFPLGGGFSQFHPADILSGKCLGLYIGGEQGCADGYNVGQRIRGLSVQDANNQREQLLLETDGESCILVKRRWTGIRCACYMNETEYPDDRCFKCMGFGFVVGFEQYVNPRRSDGRILVRFEATEDDLVMQDAGLESTFPASAWTLSVPAIKDRDFLIRFKDNENFTVTGLEAGTEEFRYEVLSVTRNKIFNNFLGRQQLKLQRVRKTDPIAHVPIQKTIGTMPRTISTSIASSAGIPPHTHTLVVNENIVAISQINGLTSVSQNHNHEVFKGEVLDQDLGHHHILLFP